ncbi:MAG: hypothetical protein EXS05_03340 [Planctomycetaceae bacterium]|nr:hypothetical protein [Planctomycetaceae bacterium]
METLQTSFQSARFNEEMAHAMCGERAALLRALDDMPLGPLRQSNARMALRLCADSIEGFSGSWQDALVRQREVGGEIRSLAKDAFSRLRFTGVILIFPATSMAAVAGAQAEARQKSANAAIAVWRFRLQHDRWPDSLDEINGMELGETTERTRKLTDPFDGNPLRYKVEERRILIYSVGDNEVDDGGALYRKGQKQPLDAGVSFKR